MAKKAEPVNRVSELLDSESLNAPSVMRPEVVVYRIKGLSPLLQNNPAEFIGKTEDSDLRAGKKTYDDAEEARLRLYPGPDGTFGHPADSFRKAAIKAVRGKKFGKLHAAPTLMGAVFNTEPRVILEDEDGEPLTAYEIGRDPVVVGSARVLRCRPRWFPWCCRLALEVDLAILRPDQVLEALSLAGRVVGTGDWRPEKGGGYGRFSVSLGK